MDWGSPPATPGLGQQARPQDWNARFPSQLSSPRLLSAYGRESDEHENEENERESEERKRRQPGVGWTDMEGDAQEREEPRWHDRDPSASSLPSWADVSSPTGKPRLPRLSDSRSGWSPSSRHLDRSDFFVEGGTAAASASPGASPSPSSASPPLSPFSVPSIFPRSESHHRASPPPALRRTPSGLRTPQPSRGTRFPVRFAQTDEKPSRRGSRLSPSRASSSPSSFPHFIVDFTEDARPSTPQLREEQHAIGRGGLSRGINSSMEIATGEVPPSQGTQEPQVAEGEGGAQGSSSSVEGAAMKTSAQPEELENLDGRILGEGEEDDYLMDEAGGHATAFQSGDDEGDALTLRDVQELQSVRVAVPASEEGQEDDSLSDFDSDLSGDEETEDTDTGSRYTDDVPKAAPRVGGVTLEDISELKQHAYELQNEFKFDFGDSVMPSFVQKKEKDSAVYQDEKAKVKMLRSNSFSGLQPGKDDFGKVLPHKKRMPVDIGCFDSLIADLKEFLGHTPFIWLYLFLLGILTAAIGGSMDWIIIYCHRLRYYLAKAPHNYWEDWFLWGSATFFFTALAIASCQISPVAQGSGIPEMKCILSGVKLKGLLSFKTLVAKVLSLTFSLSSGLMIGKKGPFVHVSAMIANLLSKVRPFHLIRENPQLYQQMLAVGCGMGVSSNFGAPIGGVLFSIEVTSTYYPVRNYLLAFQCAVISVIVYQFVSWQSATAPTNFPRECWVYTELIFHGLLGVACGLASAALVKLICQIILKRRWLAGQAGPGKGSTWLVWRAKIIGWLAHPYTYSLWVIIMTTIVTFPGNYYFMSLPGLSSLKEMIWIGELDTRPGGAKDWHSHFPVVASILFFTVSRFFGLAFSASMPIACGLYAPSLIVGAGMGRAVGEVLKSAFPDGLAFFPQDKAIEIIPATYGVVGAAAFAAGMSHTLSSAIVIMEITGQVHLLSPIILATSIAFMVSRTFTPSIYDAVTQIKGLPYLPDLEHSMFDMTADDVMERNPLSIPINASPSRVAKIMKKHKDKPTFPVIDAEDTRMLLGYVKRKDLIRWLVICTTEPGDDESPDGTGDGAPPGGGPKRRRNRKTKRKAGRKAGEDDSDEEYVMGHRGMKRKGWLLGEGLGEGEGKNLIGKTYGTFWGRSDAGLGSAPTISEEEALRRVSEKERAGAPAASKLNDIFEVKEDTEMIIFKKPAGASSDDRSRAPAADAAIVPLVTAATAVASAALSAATQNPSSAAPTAAAGAAAGTAEGAGVAMAGSPDGVRSRGSSAGRAGAELRRRGSALQRGLPPSELRQSVVFPNRPPLPVIPVPIQILDEMPMPYVHMLFIALRLSDAYVTKKGRLNGLISRETLKRVIDRHKDPTEVFLMQEGLALKDSWKWTLHQCYRRYRR